MTPDRQQIFNDIDGERSYQDDKWGTEFDDRNTANDWACYIMDYTAKATVMQDFDQATFEKHMLKVATLAVAAIETSRRNDGPAPRHYDNRQG